MLNVCCSVFPLCVYVWHVFFSFGMFWHGFLCRYFRVHTYFVFPLFLFAHWIHLISEIMRAHFQWPFSISGHWSWIPFNIYFLLYNIYYDTMLTCGSLFPLDSQNHNQEWMKYNYIAAVVVVVRICRIFYFISISFAHWIQCWFFVVSFLFGCFSFRFVVFFRLKFKMFVRFDTRNAFSTTKSTLNSIQFKWHNLSYKLAKHYSIQCAFDKVDFNILKLCREAATHRSNGPGWSSEASWAQYMLLC